MDTIAQLQAEQDELRSMAAQLYALAIRATPPAREPLIELRWRFARTLLRHLPHKDRVVYARLRRHRDPAVVTIAERYSDEAHAIFQQFLGHADRWTPEEVELHWGTYRTSVVQLSRALIDRIAREETELLPHLASAPEVEPKRAAGDRNWAADGWRIREQLGLR